MKKRQLHKLWHSPCLFLFAIIILSCNKETENTLPVITVISPLENSIFVVPSIISVQAKIEDNKKITGVELVLVNSELIPVSTAKNYFPNSSSYTLIDNYPIPVDINGGEYYLKIRANDEQNFKNEYIQIYIEGIPTELKQVLVLTNLGNDQIQVTAIEEFENISALFTIEGDYSGSEVSSENQRLFISGIEKINLQAYDLLTNELSWENEIIPNWPMHNPNCMYYNDILYLSYNSQNIHGYDYNGVKKYDSELGVFASPGLVYKHEDYLISDVQMKDGENPHISVFHATTGAELDQLATSFQVVGFISLTQDIILIIANEAGNGYIGEYNIANNILTDRYISDTNFTASVGAGTNSIFISTAEYLAIYNQSSYTLTPVLFEQGINQISYEYLSNLLLVGKEDEILVLSLPEMTNQKTILFSDSILHFHLLYSK